MRNHGRLVSRRELLHHIWGPAERKETSYLRVYLAQLRHKLEPTPPTPSTSSPRPAWATGSVPDRGVPDRFLVS